MVGLRRKLRQHRPTARRTRAQPAYVMPPRNRIYVSDALSFVRGLPDGVLDCIITSPPYFGLRSYLADDHPDKATEYGGEDTIEAYVARMVALFAECRRALKDTGVLWLNLGDSYAGSGKASGRTWENGTIPNMSGKQFSNAGFLVSRPTRVSIPDKNLLGIPWRVALALQADGWILRNDIIWAKPNPMPESVTDRCTVAHEYVFMLAKRPAYWCDMDAIREGANNDSGWARQRANGKNTWDYANSPKRLKSAPNPHMGKLKIHNSRNKRTVWTIATAPFPGSHFAVFPPALLEPMVLAGCPAQVCSACGKPWERVVETQTSTPGQRPGYTRDSKSRNDGDRAGHWIDGQRTTKGFAPTCDCNADTMPGLAFDPFMGAGTTALVARYHGRDFIGCDLNADYVAMAQDRLRLPFEPRKVKQENDVSDLPLFKAV